MSEPDLFVVCKNCSSEVSPYVTECPYCGQRVRKRAPKIDKAAASETRRARARSSLPRLRRGEIPGIAPETRPYATFALIAASLLLTLLANAAILSRSELGAMLLPFDDDPWRAAITWLIHDNLGYQFVTLVALGVFGTHLERRFGPVTALAVPVLAGAGGGAASLLLFNAISGVTDVQAVLGANGAALGALCAWLVEDRRAARRGEDRGNDLLGVLVFAAVLLLLSLAEQSAHLPAAVVGAAIGALLGLVLSALRR